MTNLLTQIFNMRVELLSAGITPSVVYLGRSEWSAISASKGLLIGCSACNDRKLFDLEVIIVYKESHLNVTGV